MRVRDTGLLKSPARCVRRPLYQRGLSLLTPFEKGGRPKAGGILGTGVHFVEAF